MTQLKRVVKTMEFVPMMPPPPQNEEVRWCEICAARGQKTKLRLFQINFNEAVTMCSNLQCVYPLGTQTKADVVDRDVSLMPLPRKRKASVHAQSTKQKLLRRTSVSAPTSRSASPCLPQLNPLQHVDNTKELKTNTRPLPQHSHTRVHAIPGPISDGLPTDTTKVYRTNLGVKSEESLSECKACPYREDSGKAKEMCKESVNPKYMHWQNKDALCWLDVLMCMLVHNQTVRILSETANNGNLIKAIVKTFDKAQMVLSHGELDAAGKKMNLETSIGMVTAKTGGGDNSKLGFTTVAGGGSRGSFCGTSRADDYDGSTALEMFPQGCTPSEDTSNASSTGVAFKVPLKRASLSNSTTVCDTHSFRTENVAKAALLLDAVREETWKSLQPRLKCRKGLNDSPVFALPLLLEKSLPLEDHFKLSYRWDMVCTNCNHHHTASVARSLVTFPNVAAEFSMNNPCFLRSCFKCLATGQKMRMVFDRLPEVLAVHFVEGVANEDVSAYDFVFKETSYAVTGLVQYCTHPDHFIAWNRRPKDNTWMKYDDLQEVLAQFEEAPPRFPPSQVHILVWERQPTPVRVPISSVQADSQESSSVPVWNSVARPVQIESPLVLPKLPRAVSASVITPVQVESPQVPPKMPQAVGLSASVITPAQVESPQVPPKVSQGVSGSVITPAQKESPLVLPKMPRALSASVITPVQIESPIVPPKLPDRVNRAPLKPKCILPVAPLCPISKEAPPGGQKTKAAVPAAKMSGPVLSRLDKTRQKLELLMAAKSQAGVLTASTNTTTFQSISRPVMSAAVTNNGGRQVPMVTSKSVVQTSSSSKGKALLKAGSGLSYLEALKPFLKSAAVPVAKSTGISSSLTKVFAGYVSKSQKNLAKSTDSMKATEPSAKSAPGKKSVTKATEKVKSGGRVGKGQRLTRTAQRSKATTESSKINGNSVAEPNVLPGTIAGGTDTGALGDGHEPKSIPQLGGSESPSAFTKVLPKKKLDSQSASAASEAEYSQSDEADSIQNPWDLLEFTEGSVSAAQEATNSSLGTTGVQSSPATCMDLSLGAEYNFDDADFNIPEFDFDSIF